MGEERERKKLFVVVLLWVSTYGLTEIASPWAIDGCPCQVGVQHLNLVDSSCPCASKCGQRLAVSGCYDWLVQHFMDMKLAEEKRAILQKKLEFKTMEDRLAEINAENTKLETELAAFQDSHISN